MPKRIDLTGKRFGRIIVESLSHINKHGKAAWHCKCDCGAYCIALTSQLNQGKKKSCGCIRRKLYNPSIKINGVTKTFYDWIDIYKIPQNIAYQRVKVLGWKASDAVMTPVYFKFRSITYEGKTMHLMDWAKHLGIKYVTLKWRLNNGWSVEEAFTIPTGNFTKGGKNP